MQTLDDRELLREYVARNSDEAFAALVARHVNLVYSVALRHTGNSHQAEEITQAVFVVLARKAPTLRPGTVVSGWLFHAARLTASNFLRNEIRRMRREQEAYMQSTLQEPGTDGDWKQIAPLLDNAIASLGETDRNAIVLRYVEGKDLKQVGAALGTGEEAAKKRVSRAVEKLRGYFVKRGVLLPVAGLTAAIAANSAPAAPAGLAASAAALAAVKGATAGASTLALIKGTIKLMAWTKTRIAIGVGVTVLLATAGGVAVGELKHGSGPQTAAEIAGRVRDKYNSLTSYQDTGTILRKSGKPADEKIDAKSTFETVLDRAGHYRVSERQQLTTNNGTNWTDPVEQACWFAGEGHLTFNQGKTWNNPGNIPAGSVFFNGGAPVGVPLSFFKPDDYLLQDLAPPANLTREKDEKIGEVDCYVLAGGGPEGEATLCIGKADLLIHQIRQLQPGQMLETPDGSRMQNRDSVTIETHENIVVNGPVTTKDFTFTPTETGLTAAELVKKVKDTYASLTSYRDTGTWVDSGYDTPVLGTTKWIINIRLARTNRYLIETKTANLTMTAWSEGRDNFVMSRRLEAGQETCFYWKSVDRLQTLNRLMVGNELPRFFFGAGGDFFEGKSISRGADEKIGGIDCYILTNTVQELEGRPVQLIAWIGKSDWLIRQTRYVTPAPEGTEEYTTTHENILINEPVKQEDFKFELPVNAVLSGPDRKVTPQIIK